jgi:hypothetical protein
MFCFVVSQKLTILCKKAGVTEPKFVKAQESIPRSRFRRLYIGRWNRFIGIDSCASVPHKSLKIPSQVSLYSGISMVMRYFGCRIESNSTTTLKDFQAKQRIDSLLLFILIKFKHIFPNNF